MGFIISKAHELMNSALDYRTARQDMISGNIANVDTPFYRPRDISFEDVLAQKSSEIFNSGSHTLKMAKTNALHLDPSNTNNTYKPTIFFRDGHQARNDGNSVDLDVETTELSKNSTMYNAIAAAKKKYTGIYKSVIDASGKTS